MKAFLLYKGLADGDLELNKTKISCRDDVNTIMMHLIANKRENKPVLIVPLVDRDIEIPIYKHWFGDRFETLAHFERCQLYEFVGVDICDEENSYDIFDDGDDED